MAPFAHHPVKSAPRHARGGILFVSLITLLASGCALTEQLSGQPEAPKAAPTVQPNSSTIRAYLDTMNGLGVPDAAHQADVFYEVEREYTRAPTTASTLNYAVALVTPGHPATSPSEGKRLLETLLATPERMTQEERTLCAVLLNETNVRLKLEAENRRLVATLDDRSRSQANSDRRVQAQVEENARLRRALAEAQQKLDAIKEIERSIIERSATPPGSRDSAANSNEAQSSSIGR
jgi:YfhG lipoprotein